MINQKVMSPSPPPTSSSLLLTSSSSLLQVVGYDTNRPELGTMFEVPITIVKPKVVETTERAVELGTHTYTSGQTRR